MTNAGTGLVPSNRWLLLLSAWLLSGLCAPSFSSAAEPLSRQLGREQLGRETGRLSAEQDDATLRSVTFLGQSLGWAVGDRGTILKTEDGGQTWRGVSTPVEFAEATFESVQFLSNRIGWIASGGVSHVRRVQHGFVLLTEDGGETWKVISESQLPYLRKIHFTDPDNGIAAGERTSTFPGGVVVTQDGGRTWHALATPGNATWNDITFFDAYTGVAVGDAGRQATLANGRMLPGSANFSDLQGMKRVSAKPDGIGWIVGEGALTLVTRDRGASWSLPEGAFPPEFQDYFEFWGVAQQGERVWIGGHPGSVIWHSRDAGRTWERQLTGDPAPLRSLYFSSPEQGVAVGDFGRICITRDGGKTWTNVRGAQRHLACWAVHGHASRVPFQFLSRWAREGGYRTSVTLATRRDLGVDAHAASQQRVWFEQAVLAAGGNQALLDWRLPVPLPGLDRDFEKLQEEWSQLTDLRLGEVLQRNLIVQIRSLRPEVILLDEPPEDDAVTQTLHRILPQVVQQAADPSVLPDHAILGLEPWQVKKVVLERAVGRGGTIRQAPYEVLPRLRTTLDVATLRAASRLLTAPAEASLSRSYEVLYVAPDAGLTKSNIWGDLKIPAGSSARRAIPAIRGEDLDQLLEESQRRQTMTALTQQLINTPEQGAQLLAQLREIVRPLSPEQAAQQLADLALKYRQAGQWSLAEETYAHLIKNYAEQPPALEAMLWLATYTTSAEMNWQRLRSVQASRGRVQVSPEVLQANFTKALEIAREQPSQAGFLVNLQQLPRSYEPATTPLQPTVTTFNQALHGGANAASQHEVQLQRWRDLAGGILTDLTELYPRLAEEDDIQFMAAALARRKLQGRKADDIYGRYLQRLNDDDPWHVAAKGEVYLLRPGVVSPKPVAISKTTNGAPILDGRLTDPCWAVAREIELLDSSAFSSNSDEQFIGNERSTGGANRNLTRTPVVMFAHDAEYLYIGGSVPKHPGINYEAIQQPGRPRDADLGRYDRISIQLDIDRDYTSYYRFEIDQRGWTRESCWEALGYNPQWYVACDQNRKSWTFEIAIPWEELQPGPPEPAAVWAVGIARIMPGIGSQSWTPAGADIPLPPRFGFLRFE